ncbi:MAG: glycosyl hydrolase 108 family protein [Hyphomicrobiaceae bacterium]
MEGGYSDDPQDPGGPTNKGITLATYAAFEGAKLDGRSRAKLLAGLKAIPDDTVARIYEERYWRKSFADRLRPGLALMHFDAAVNHGVGRAAQFLQEALDVEIDGEIGPLTLAAATTADIAGTLDTYADLRRAAYRRLSTFPRFGRGWLARVEHTLAAARALDERSPDAAPVTEATPVKEETTSMTDFKKWWGQSVTIWGAVVAGLAAVLPALGPLLGLAITPDAVVETGDQIGQLVQALAGLVGTALAIYGRVRATRQLAQKSLSFRL